MTLKFDRWPWKTIGHLFYPTSSFVHHFALCIISQPSVNSNWSYSLETPNSGQNWKFFVPRDLEIWQMTLKNDGAPLLIYFKLCALFCSYWWNQTGVTVRKNPIWVKISDFFVPVTLLSDTTSTSGDWGCHWAMIWNVIQRLILQIFVR